MVSTGGTSLRDDIVRLGATVHVVVATPGRVLDLAQKGVCKLGNCGIAVMDEADKLLSEDFQPVVEQLLALLPPSRQVGAVCWGLLGWVWGGFIILLRSFIYYVSTYLFCMVSIFIIISSSIKPHSKPKKLAP